MWQRKQRQKKNQFAIIDGIISYVLYQNGRLDKFWTACLTLQLWYSLKWVQHSQKSVMWQRSLQRRVDSGSSTVM